MSLAHEDIYASSKWVRLFEAFSLSLRMEGLDGSSIATSAKLRWAPASYNASDTTVISPALRKPKKQVHTAAQSMILFQQFAFSSHTSLSFFMIPGVIGRRVRLPRVDFAWWTLMPFSTCSSLAMLAMPASAMPWAICKWQMADK